MFRPIQKANNGQLSYARWLSWILSLVGSALVLTPFIEKFSTIPLMEVLMPKSVLLSIFVLALIWSVMLHYIILLVTWVVYRPAYAILYLAIVISCITLCHIK